MAIPLKDSALAAWSTNFDTRVSATPTVFGLTATQATAYGTVHDAYITAYNAVNTVGARSKSLVAAKDTAKKALLDLGRELYAFVQASVTVTDANKELLDVVVRKTEPTPVPPPSASPGFDIVSVTGRIVNVRLHDTATPSRRGKPAGVKGASVFSYVGATPPNEIAAWKFEGSTGKTTVDVEFGADLAPGTKVWLTAFWFNNRSQSGPACEPVSTVINYGGLSMAA